MSSNLLKTVLLPASSTPPAISVSSWHLSTRTGSPDQLVSEEAFSSSNSNWGGDIYHPKSRSWEFKSWVKPANFRG
ncbi:MAG: hypothetical protein WCG66_06615 [bacterium]